MHLLKEKAPIVRRPRLVPRGDELEIVTTGHTGRSWRSDLYVRLLEISWTRLLFIIALTYFGVNLLFAAFFFETKGAIVNARPGVFGDAFFFSVQTLATIGYGQMYPQGVLANVLVTMEAFIGFVFYAMVTGIVFAKFSRPTARVMFSEKAVICPYEGVPHLMVRLANERTNRIVDANVHMILVRNVTTRENHKIRRFIDIIPERTRSPLIRFSWTLLHKIDESSPLYGMDFEKMRDAEQEIIISLTGLDETLSQTIHARYSYVAEEIAFDSVFEDVLLRSEDGQRLEVNYDKFHAVRPYEMAA